MRWGAFYRGWMGLPDACAPLASPLIVLLVAFLLLLLYYGLFFLFFFFFAHGSWHQFGFINGLGSGDSHLLHAVSLSLPAPYYPTGNLGNIPLYKVCARHIPTAIPCPALLDYMLVCTYRSLQIYFHNQKETTTEFSSLAHWFPHSAWLLLAAAIQFQDTLAAANKSTTPHGQLTRYKGQFDGG
jgi:hypothetical protein